MNSNSFESAFPLTRSSVYCLSQIVLKTITLILSFNNSCYMYLVSCVMALKESVLSCRIVHRKRRSSYIAHKSSI